MLLFRQLLSSLHFAFTEIFWFTGGIFAKIVNMALDRKSDVETVSEIEDKPPFTTIDDETDTDFHETLPQEVLKIKDITLGSNTSRRENDGQSKYQIKHDSHEKNKLKVLVHDENEKSEKKAVMEKKHISEHKSDKIFEEKSESIESDPQDRKYNRKQTSDSSTQSRQSDSLGSIIPVITISTTESDEEILQMKDRKERRNKEQRNKADAEEPPKLKKSHTDLKSLQRQNSVESINEQKTPKEKKPDEGHKYQYSL